MLLVTCKLVELVGLEKCFQCSHQLHGSERNFSNLFVNVTAIVKGHLCVKKKKKTSMQLIVGLSFKLDLYRFD